MSKNILIVQNFNPNKGNNSVVTAMMSALQGVDVNIEITSAVPESAVEQYGVPCFDWLVSYKNILYSKSKIKKLLALICEILWVIYLLIWIVMFKIHIKLWVPMRKKKTIDAYQRADVVVFPGGHSFTTMNGLGQVFSHCMGFYFGKIIGKKTMVYAHTVGPFTGIWAPIIRGMSLYVLKRTDVVTIREKDSLKYCTRCNAILTAETVFGIPTELQQADCVKELQEIRETGNIVVGLTIHHIYYKYFFTKDEYIRIMADCINIMTQQFACNVLLIPMESKTGNYNDRDLAYEIKKMLVLPESFKIIDEDYEPIVTSAIIGKCDMFVGTKTHSIVYGLKAEVPTLCIAYQQKANEFMEMYGVPENAINLSDLNSTIFQAVFSRMIADLDGIKTIQRNHNKLVRQKALENRDILLTLLND